MYPADVPDAPGVIGELSASEPAFRSAVEACCDVLRAEAAGGLADLTLLHLPAPPVSPGRWSRVVTEVWRKLCHLSP